MRSVLREFGAVRRPLPVKVDLTEVTFVNDAGKRLLAVGPDRAPN